MLGNWITHGPHLKGANVIWHEGCRWRIPQILQHLCLMLGEQAGLCPLHMQLPAVGCLERGVHWLRKLLDVPPTLSQIVWSGCAAECVAETSAVSLSRRTWLLPGM